MHIYSHIKAYGLSPNPTSKGNSSTEGLLGRHAFPITYMYMYYEGTLYRESMHLYGDL